MDVLQLDVSGRPQAWMTVKEAAVLYACDAVAWTLGEPRHVMRGGVQRATGLQSRIEVHAIIAVRGTIPSRAWRQAPARTNPNLFARDRPLCAYYGVHQPAEEHTREHIMTTSRRGLD
ncbi:MAG: HNH endonuclease, partial [Burkholderiaceae bacterium]